MMDASFPPQPRLTCSILLTLWWRRFHRPGHFRSALLAADFRMERKKSSKEAKKAPASVAESRYLGHVWVICFGHTIEF
jgi:hypothetical protein